MLYIIKSGAIQIITVARIRIIVSELTKKEDWSVKYDEEKKIVCRKWHLENGLLTAMELANCKIVLCIFWYCKISVHFGQWSYYLV